MDKIFEVNGQRSKYPLDLPLCKDDGQMEDYYLVSGDTKDKITLADMVNNQVKIIDAEIVAKMKKLNSEASCGNSNRHASSGDYAIHEATGVDNVVFACGFQSIIKSSVGTWISLCEYKENETRCCVPHFIKSAQIGNPEYVDADGQILCENEYYILHNREFHKAINADGLLLLKKKVRKIGDIVIHKCHTLGDAAKKVFIAQSDSITAHGKTVKQAVYDLEFKLLKDYPVEEHVERVKQQGFVSRVDYRLITRACFEGIDMFREEHGIIDDKIELPKLFEILDDNRFGAKKFKELLMTGTDQ